MIPAVKSWCIHGVSAGGTAKAKDLLNGATLRCTYKEAKGNPSNLQSRGRRQSGFDERMTLMILGEIVSNEMFDEMDSGGSGCYTDDNGYDSGRC
jgi:hypothetical protein